MTDIRVLLVDDHPFILEGYTSVLAREIDITVVGTAQNGEEALQLAQDKHPDIVLMDIEMKGMSGVQATRHLHTLCPQSRVLVVSAHDKREYVVQALSAGAWDYVLKDLAAQELVSAIRATMQGERYMQRQVVRTLFDQAANNEAPIVLSERERDVLCLIEKGLRDPQIAEQLSLSLSAVKKNVRNLLAKLDVPSRHMVVEKAYQRGILGAC